MHIRQQLEMNLPPGQRSQTVRRPHRARSQWWFSRMRQVVDLAQPMAIGSKTSEHANHAQSN